MVEQTGILKREALADKERPPADDASPHLKFEQREQRIPNRGALLLRRENLPKVLIKHARRQRPRPLQSNKTGSFGMESTPKRTTPPERNMIARRRRYFRGRASNPQQEKQPRLRRACR